MRILDFTDPQKRSGEGRALDYDFDMLIGVMYVASPDTHPLLQTLVYLYRVFQQIPSVSSWLILM